MNVNWDRVRRNTAADTSAVTSPPAVGGVNWDRVRRNVQPDPLAGIPDSLRYLQTTAAGAHVPTMAEQPPKAGGLDVPQQEEPKSKMFPVTPAHLLRQYMERRSQGEDVGLGDVWTAPGVKPAVHSIWPLLQNINRTGYGAAGAINAAATKQLPDLKEDPEAHLGGLLRPGGPAASATWRGLTLQETPTTRDSWDKIGYVKEHPWLGGLLGLATDVAIDPMTYVGLGPLTKTGKGAKFMKGVDMASDLAKPATGADWLRKAATGKTFREAAQKAVGEGVEKFGKEALELAPTKAGQAALGQRSLLSFAGKPVVSPEASSKVFGALEKAGMAAKTSKLGKLFSTSSGNAALDDIIQDYWNSISYEKKKLFDTAKGRAKILREIAELSGRSVEEVRTAIDDLLEASVGPSGERMIARGAEEFQPTGNIVTAVEVPVTEMPLDIGNAIREEAASRLDLLNTVSGPQTVYRTGKRSGLIEGAERYSDNPQWYIELVDPKGTYRMSKQSVENALERIMLGKGDNSSNARVLKGSIIDSKLGGYTDELYGDIPADRAFSDAFDKWSETIGETYTVMGKEPVTSIHPRATALSEEIAGDLKSGLAREHAAGVPTPEFAGDIEYLSHLRTDRAKEWLAEGGKKRKNLRQAFRPSEGFAFDVRHPNQLQRTFGWAVDDAAVDGKKWIRDMAPDEFTAHATAGDLHYPGITEANQIMRDKHGIDFDFFQTDPAAIAYVRGVRTSRAVAAGDMFRSAASEFGVVVDDAGKGPQQPWQRTPAMFEEARYPKAADVVDGRVVREDVPNMSSIGASVDDYDVAPGIREVPMSDLTPWKEYAADDVRRVDELAVAIRESGEINPLIIAIDSEGPYIVEGGHRYLALDKLGAKSFPAVVVVETDAHYGAVKKALGAGHKVSRNVIEEYPDLLEQFGKSIAVTDVPEGYRYLKAQHIPEDVRRVAFPDDIAEHLDKHYDIITNADKLSDIENAFGRASELYGEYMRMWKGYTLTSPSYHSRNVIGDFWNASLAGLKNPIRYAEAFAVQTGEAVAKPIFAKLKIPWREGKITTRGGKVYTLPEVLDQAERYARIGSGFYGSNAEDVAKLSAEAVKVAGEGGGGLIGKILGNEGVVLRANFKLGEFRENNGRLALFIDRLVKGDTPEAAGKVVLKHLFDYQNITQFEKGIRKYVSPFYTWYRKNIPLQLENLVTQPGRYSQLEKGRGQIEYGQEKLPEELLPEFIREAAPVQTGRTPEGGYKVERMESYIPGFDIGRVLRPGETAVEQLGPLWGTLAGLQTGVHPWTEKPIEKYPGQPGELLGFTEIPGTGIPIGRWAEYLTRGVTPAGRAIGETEKLFGLGWRGREDMKPSERLTRYLTGRRAYVIDAERQEYYGNLDADKALRAIQYELRRSEEDVANATGWLARMQAEMKVKQLRQVLADTMKREGIE